VLPLCLALFGWLALARLAAAGGTAEEFWPEVDITYQHDSHLPVSKLVALNAVLNVYF
jgi:hypothetical protein